MRTLIRSLTAAFAALVILHPAESHAVATYNGTCSGCHGGFLVGALPNGTSTNGSIRAANNLTYLNDKINNHGMGSPTTTALITSDRQAIVNEIGASASVAAPVITSSAPPGGTRGTAYSFTVTTTAKPSLAVGSIAGAIDPLPNAFTVTTGALPTGLAINGSTGAITGTPSVAGTFTGTIGANNLIGTPASQAFSIVIAKTATSTALGTSVTPTTFGQSVTFTATVTSGLGTPTGTVQFKDGGVNLGAAVTLSGGIATLATTALTVSAHSITAVYSGDTNNLTSTSSTVTQTVNKANSTSAVVTSGSPSVAGQSVTFTATVSGPGTTPTGTVQFKDGGVNLGAAVALSGGIAALTTSALSVSAHSITAVYSGDANYNTSTSSTLTQTVNQASTSTALTSSANPSVFGQSVTFTATVSATGFTPTGTIQFKDAGVNLGAAVTMAAGVATLSTSALSVATHSITAVYSGDTNGLTSTSSAVSQVVNKASTTTAVVTSGSPSVVGQNVTFTATVSATGFTPTGTVQFKDGVVNIGSAVTMVSGVAALTTSALTASVHSITAVYSGDTNGLTSTSSALSQTVNQASTSTTVTSSVNPSVVGQSVTFTATVSATGYTPTGTVQFKDNGVNLGAAATLSSGVATLTTSALALGGHPISAVYSGDANATTSTSPTITQTVSALFTTTTALVSTPNPSLVGQSVLFTATVSGPSGTPTGTVTFKDSVGAIGAPVTLVGGVATFSTGAIAAGTNAITAVYSGDASNATSTSAPVSQVVQRASTTTLVYNPTTVACGSQTTLTFTVTGSGPTPTGTVTIHASNNSVQGAGVLNASGVGTTFLNFAGAATQSFSADYPGDANYAASSSGLQPFTVTPATTTVALTSSGSPAAFGASVTFTAAVPAVGTCFAPTGSVTFKDGLTTIGAGTISGGVATFTTSSLAAGAHSITATYAGNTNYATVVSSPLAFTVNAQLFALTVAKNGSGQGSVASLPAGIACGATCSASFANGTAITLTATPAAGSVFSTWTGCDSVAGPQCTVNIAAARGVTATFVLDPLGDADGDGIPNGVELTEGRDPLVKDNDVFANNRLFVMQQYRDFLSREGDVAGIQGWIDLLNAGTYNRLQVIDAFLSSNEFAGFVAPVVRLYFATFLRVPDYAGLTFNAGLVRNGTITVVQLADFFTQSPEFMATYGALNDTQFVTLLYNNVLGRAPDTAGLNGWVSLLGSGYTRGQVLLGFSDSPEYQASIANEVFVTMMYAGMLRRTPEPTGFAGWVNFLDTAQLTRAQVINGFFLSTEYHNRFLP